MSSLQNPANAASRMGVVSSSPGMLQKAQTFVALFHLSRAKRRWATRALSVCIWAAGSAAQTALMDRRKAFLAAKISTILSNYEQLLLCSTLCSAATTRRKTELASRKALASTPRGAKHIDYFAAYHS